jgi:1-acyl-sn-glycerol-3-phosphate acyltransferase
MIEILAVFHSLIFWSMLFILLVLLSFYPTHSMLRFVSKILLAVGLVKVKVKGLENVPKGEGMLLAANHPGFIDFLVHYKIFPFKFRFVIAYTFFKVPILRRLVTKMKYIPVGEEKRKKIVMTETAAKIIFALKKNEPLFVFPEGQRKKEPSEVMARFRPWAARIAQATCVPVVPIAVKGSEKILPKLRFLMYPGTVKVLIGQPFYLDKKLSPQKATMKLQQEIMRLYGEL